MSRWVVVCAAALLLDSVQAWALPAEVPQSEYAAAAETGVAGSAGVSALRLNPALLVHEAGARFSLAPMTAVGLEVSSGVVSVADAVYDVAQDGFTVGGLEEMVSLIESGGTPPTQDIQTLVGLLTRGLTDMTNQEEGILAGTHFMAGYHHAPWAVSVSTRFLSGAGAELDLDPDRMALYTEGDPQANVRKTLGSGADYSGSFAQPESQPLADRIQRESILTQNQAEQLVYMAESVNAALSDARTADALVAFARGFTPTLSPDVGILNNRSGLTVRSINLTRITGGWSYRTWGQRLSLGVAGSLIHGMTYVESVGVNNISLKNEAIEENLFRKKNMRVSWNVGLDLGAALTLHPWTTVGLALRDANRPTFKMARGANLRIHPQLVAGFAFRPHRSFQASLEFDLIERRTDLLGGVGRRMAKLGAAFHPWKAFGLQAGWRRDVSDGSEGTIYSGGLSFNIQGVGIGLALSASDRWQTVDKRKGRDLALPTSSQLNLHVSWIPELEG